MDRGRSSERALGRSGCAEMLSRKMIARKNSRRVFVDDEYFRYKISLTPKSKGIYCLNITVVGEGRNGSKLFIKGLIQKNYSVLAEASEFRFYAEVTQHEMHWLIREAILRRWEYTLPSSDYTLTVTNDIFELGFFRSIFLQAKVREAIAAASKPS